MFLAGRQQDCVLLFTTSGDTDIPPHAPVQVTSPDPAIHISLPASTQEETPVPEAAAPSGTEEGDGPRGVKLLLPSLEPGEACQKNMALEVPAVNDVLEMMCSAEDTTTLVAWRRNVSEGGVASVL